MENEEIKDLNGTENEEEQREASIDEEFGEAISAALEETHKEMEEKQERADEAARERAEIRGKKEAVHKAKEKPPRNYEAEMCIRDRERIGTGAGFGRFGLRRDTGFSACGKQAAHQSEQKAAGSRVLPYEAKRHGYHAFR